MMPDNFENYSSKDAYKEVSDLIYALSGVNVVDSAPVTARGDLFTNDKLIKK